MSGARARSLRHTGTLATSIGPVSNPSGDTRAVCPLRSRCLADEFVEHPLPLPLPFEGAIRGDSAAFSPGALSAHSSENAAESREVIASCPALESRKRRAVALDVLIDRTRRVAG